MMRRLSLLFVVALALAAQVCCAAAAPAAKNGVGITPPMALFVPQGGKIVTEVNISDTDLLGVVKLVLSQMSMNAEDTGSFADAITDVKSIRALAIQLPKGTDSAKAMSEAEAWVCKAGKFTKIFNDTGFAVGQIAVYAQANNAGYVAFGYDANKNVMYAGRLSGSVNVAKLLDIASGFAPVTQAVQSFKESKPGDSTNAPAAK